MEQKLIYILGAGRSGTTILDIVLGNCSNAISLGEINRFFKRNGIAPKRETDSKVYKFWESIKEAFDGAQAEDYGKLKKLFDKNEYHTYFPKIYLFGANKLYRQVLIKQYHSILQNTSQDILVESSKYPARAINISSSLNKNLEIAYVYLKKDPVKVVASFGKKGLEQPAKPFLASNLYYFVINFFCHLAVWKLRNRGHKVVMVTYEDLISKPLEVLDEIGQKLEIDAAEAQRKIENAEALDTGFLFDGNRIRIKPGIVLQRDIKKEKNKGLSYFFTRSFNYLIYRK